MAVSGLPIKKDHSPMLALVLALACLAMLGPFTTDTYFPFFPDMEAHFAISQAQAQQSLTVYLFTFTAMMLFHGALSDSFGRRPVILVSLSGFIIASLLCAMTDNFSSLLVYRGMQGLFVGAGTVVGQAVIRDKFAGVQAQRLIAQITMLFGIAPAIAPLLGGWLHQYFPWQSSFFLLSGLGILILLLCFVSIDETLPPHSRQQFALKSILGNYIGIFREPRFLALSGCIATGFGGFLVYVGGSHDFIFKVMHMSSLQFGWLFIPIVIGLIAGSALATRLTGRVSNHAMINSSHLIMGVAAGFNVLYNLLTEPSMPMAVVPVLLYTFGLTLMMPAAMMLALDLFPQSRGTAASVQAFIQSLIFVLLSAFVVPVILGNGTLYASVMLVMLVGNVVLWNIYKTYR
ncbi:MFS transporter, DHA1 family, bicyclomycin/chloramphenicol resistance protein [Methylobacillus rhizosphaerae]|uniref:Bcr/CflA family efflux transporter n=2 Tax=Methylobacillus rhizosphaerae TaxID=551994 RepID=A0A239A339_9PROT|nr:MFS transporter, DHA1 family, bicyclomycin/chloramphenicol resistance protein [Methylobacillus rhizosphaerae]